MKTTLVTGCKDRNKCLEVVLPSWLQYSEINEIIIVDWSSQIPLNHLLDLDNRIKIIRVENEQYYIPSQANNLGISFASNEKILRVDTDYFLNPYFNFFNTYHINDSNFICGFPQGNSKCSTEINPYFLYLRGLLYITKNNFKKIGGYNEFIGKYYGFEDDELFCRLRKLGLEQVNLKQDHTIIHIPHPDKKRYENFEGDNGTTENNIKQHLKKFFTGEELEWQTQYQTGWTMCSYNQTAFNTPKHHFLKPFVRWNIQKNNEQYFVATRVKNNLELFPQINCVSLEESVTRREEILKQFKKYSIDDIVFITSKRYEESNDIIEGKQVHTLNGGTKGCCISHFKMIKNWLDTTGEDYGFFCEDDLSLETVQYWDNSWKEFVKTLPDDWDCVQLLTIRNNGLSLDIRERLWDDWGATAYILKRDYAKKIIETFCKNGKYLLELPEPSSNIQPLIENLLFTIGKTYTIPLFIENTQFESTFVKTDTDINAATSHKNNHIIAAQKVLQLWKKEVNIIHDYAKNVDDPVNNFKAGEYYYTQGHTAPALSYFLRCAERTEDKLLAYEALIYGYFCYKEQKIRDETAKSLIMHAVTLLPERPEARYLLSVFYEHKQMWMDSYYHACLGLNADTNLEELTFYKDHPGKIGLLFQKAIAGYWWGKNNECKEILLDLHYNHKLNDTYKEAVLNNLKRIGVEVT